MTRSIHGFSWIDGANKDDLPFAKTKRSKAKRKCRLSSAWPLAYTLRARGDCMLPVVTEAALPIKIVFPAVIGKIINFDAGR